MARSLFTSQRAFPLIVILTLAAALLPARALGWTKLLAEIISIPIIPFADPLNQLAAMLRPAPRHDLPGGITMDAVDRLEAEAEEFKRLYLAELARVEALEAQLSQLQGFDVRDARRPVRTVLAHIALRSTSAQHGAVRLNLGSNHGVQSGAMAVYDHIHLMGRVTDVAAMHCTMLPLANRATGPIRAAVVAQDRMSDTISLANLPTVAVDPKGDGTFRSNPDKSTIINVGDEIILMDESWPASAQGMRIGLVESVAPDEQRPLRHIVVIRPAYQVSQIALVVLRIEGAPASATGNAGGTLP